MKPGTRWLRLSVLLCLMSVDLRSPSTSPRAALAENLPTAPEASIPSPIAPPSAETELHAAREPSWEAGSEAVVALARALYGEALEVAMLDTLEARRLLAEGRAQASAVQTPADAEAPAATLTVGTAPCTYATIAAAVTAANPGDLLLIQGGATFNENVSINKNLILEGGYTGCTGGTTDRATINAGSTGRSVYVTGSKVTLRNLQITGGDATTGGGVYATNGAVIILESAEVTANTAYFGGGIFVDAGTEVALTEGSTVHDNTAKIAGGGVRVRGRLIATDTHSGIDDNTAPHGGGASVSGGVLHLIEADMSCNRATDPAGMGGAILLEQGGVVTTTGNVWITGANQAVDGAGIYADDSEVFLEYAVLSDNVATDRGGGLFLTNGSTLSATFAFIGYPTGSNRARDGAGIYVDDSTVTFGGKIQNNIASNSGAGLYAINSTLAMVGAQVGGTDYNQANQLGPDGIQGVGLYLAATHATLLDTSIAGNIFQTTGDAFGGGAYVAGGSIVTLTNSTIESHAIPSPSDGRGAGIYLHGSTATLDNSAVLSNTANTLGGGVRVAQSAVLNIINGSVLRNNHARLSVGGAIAGDIGGSDVHISDATLRDNTAGTDGGAVHMYSGALDFTGAWTLRHNTAGGNGGAVAVVGTATANFNAGGYSLAYDNVAEGGHGGMVYLGNDRRTDLHAISGHELYIYANRAGGNGGALYADGGGLFDIYGQVRFDSNRADNGGAIYLSDYSAIWLDDHDDARPELWDNRAYPGSGGAIYALRSPGVECDGATLGRVGEGNQASKLGGAIYMDGSILDADNCIFQDNRAGADGGAIAAVNSSTRIHATYPSVALEAECTDALHPLDAQAILATACDPRSQLCSVFSGNVVADSEGNYVGHGGAIYNQGSTLTVDHTDLHDNRAAEGGAIYQRGTSASAQIENALIQGNTVSSALGAGIRSSEGDFTLNHVTLAGNVGGPGFSGTATEVRNTVAWDNDGYPGFSDAPLTVSCNLDDGGHAGPMIDPQFVAPVAGEDYRLRSTSPAIDACATGLSPDLLNQPRPYGDAYDMGAFECVFYSVYLPLTLR